MRITEIFYSIQGEAQASGLPCVFVRLAGCPYRCTYCDTTYAREDEGEDLSLAVVLERLAPHPCRLVEITGGEPMAQESTPDLIRLLQAEGYKVLLETSGHLPLDRLPPGVSVVMDIKTPGSGNPGFHQENLRRLGPDDAAKFVICGPEDFEWAIGQVRRQSLTERTAVFFSPSWGQVQPADLASWILRSGLPIRFQLPLHKVLWEDARGH